ncbi:MAG: hypothetical protein FJW39_25150 [Acidobacteria bacterium]|nr:hypothetical protein [Acidobacteriota bacterium]
MEPFRVDPKEEEPDHIVGARKADIGFVCPGSALVPCIKCGEQVWIARSGQAKMKAGKLKPICIQCVLAIKSEEVKVVLPSRQDVLSDLMSEN